MTDTCEFYWLVPGKLAGSAYPGACLKWLYQTMGIRSIVSLHPLTPKDHKYAESLGFQISAVSIDDFTPGTPEQRNHALQAIQKSLLHSPPTLVHCKGGLGRTGMILAIYLVREKQLPANKAIARIRSLRPGSIETLDQEEVILTNGNYCH
jgi:atypical dual specificity phosphatase